MWALYERERELWSQVFQTVRRLPEQPAAGAAWTIKATDGTLRTVLPPGFEAHARIMHPAWKKASGPAEGGVDLAGDIWARPVSWSQIGAATGQQVDGRSDFDSICSHKKKSNRAAPPDRVWTLPPEEGVTSDPNTIAALFAHLATATPAAARCWCGFWAGHHVNLPASGNFHAGYDLYRLYRTMFGDLRDWWQKRDPRLGMTELTPTMFWPEGGHWYVAIPYYATSTYVAGSRSLIDAILKDSELEAHEVCLSDSYWPGLEAKHLRGAYAHPTMVARRDQESTGGWVMFDEGRSKGD